MANIDEKVTSFGNKFVDVANFVDFSPFVADVKPKIRSAVSANFLFLLARLRVRSTRRDAKDREMKIFEELRSG